MFVCWSVLPNTVTWVRLQISVCYSVPVCFRVFWSSGLCVSVCLSLWLLICCLSSVHADRTLTFNNSLGDISSQRVAFVSLCGRSCLSEQCESRGGRPNFPVPNKPDGFCGHKKTLKTTKKKKKGKDQPARMWRHVSPHVVSLRVFSLQQYYESSVSFLVFSLI